MRLLLAAILFAMLTGCTSTPAPAMRNVPVEYRFENVRQIKGGANEWADIQGVLQVRLKRPITAEVVRERAVADGHVRTYRTSFIAPDLATIEAIHNDLESLRRRALGSSRIDYHFAGLNATYKSSFVTAGASTLISGQTVEGNKVRIFTAPGADAIDATVSRGLWHTRLDAVPDDRWVYGISEHPANALPRRYFRLNVSNLRTDALDESEFAAWYGKAPPPLGNAARASAPTN